MKRTRTRPGAGPEAFDELVEAHLGDVHRYLVYLTGDRALAEDLTADAFERAWRQRDRFDPRRAGPRSWLLAIARTCALDHLRAERRRGARERLAAQREPGRAAEDAAGLCDGYSAALETGLARLSAADREVIALRVLLDLDAGEAARLLEITATACTTRLSRALARLAAEVESHERV
jgi:RNA polymerase sigma factor (sigma-70 family)